MAVVVGNMGSPTGTGTVTVTGLPFEPVAVVFYTVIGNLTPPGIMLGCATAAGEEWVIWTGMDTEISTAYNIKYNQARSDSCLFNSAPPFGTVAYRGEFIQMTSDGFEVDIVTYNGPGGQNISYMAIGGDNISDAYAGMFTAGASTGTTAVTAPGFTPKALIMAHQMSTFGTSNLANVKWGVGVAANTDQYSVFASAEPASTHRVVHRTDAIACGCLAAGSFVMELDSWDANGFTVDVTDASSGDHDFGYLAIDCAAAAVGNDIIPDAPTTQDLPTPGLEAEGVFFLWNGVNVPSTTCVTSGALFMRPGVGSGTLSTNLGVGFLGRDDFPFGLYNVIGWRDTASIILRGQGSGVDPNANTVQAAAVVSALAPDVATITWGTAASGWDRAFGWLALPGEVPQSPWIPHIYRRVLG